MTPNSGDNASRHRQVVIIGAGFGGLGAAVQLRANGVHDLLMLERNTDVGGTWYDNTYPGCQCDVQSDLYSLSFALNPDWSRTYSPQPEIKAYLQRVADDFQLRSHIRFQCEVREARWDNSQRLWRLATNQGEFTAQVLVSAQGAFSEPIQPAIAGLEDFQGEILRSARWNHQVDLTGKRVGVIGTGASAVQIIPAIQPLVQQLDVFQRTPAWIVPRYDRAVASWKKKLLRTLPVLQRLKRWAQYLSRELLVPPLVYSPFLGRWVERWARMHLRKQVQDTALRAKLRPNYRIGCKRILLSNDYYPALQQPNAALVTDAIDRVTPQGILTADGKQRPLDALVLATGFRVANHPFNEHIVGRTGVTLAAAWKDGAAAYLGITIPDFPNLFLLSGPNTGIGHTSLVFMLEAQTRYLVESLKWMQRQQRTVLELEPAACAQFVTEMQRRSTSTTWGGGGCSSWYLDEHGRNTTVWPGFTFEYWWRTRRFDASKYRLE